MAECTHYRRVDTVDELVALPKATVVMSAAGTLGCKTDSTRGVIFGDHRTFLWTSLMLPVIVVPIPAPGEY